MRILVSIFVLAAVAVAVADEANKTEDESHDRAKRSLYDGPDHETYSYTHYPSYGKRKFFKVKFYQAVS